MITMLTACALFGLSYYWLGCKHGREAAAEEMLITERCQVGCRITLPVEAYNDMMRQINQKEAWIKERCETK